MQPRPKEYIGKVLKPAGQSFDIVMLGGEFGTQMSCEEANCSANREGWVSVMDTTNSQMAGAANWIKRFSGRKFYEWGGLHALEDALRIEAQGDMTVTPELRAMLGGLTDAMAVFYFLPGQQCFKTHEDREVQFQHQQRQGVYVHQRPVDFNEDFNETADRERILRQRG